MKPVVFGILMTLLAGVGLGWLWYSQQPPQSEPVQPVANETAEPAPEKQLHPVVREPQPTEAAAEPTTDESPATTSAPSVPPLTPAPTDLNQSDATTREVIKDLSRKEELPTSLLQWLTPKEQVRKWVLLVNNVAMGKVPVKNRPLEFSMKPFAVTGTEDQPLLAEANFTRLDPLVNAFVSLDAQLLARYYRAWEPLLQEAYDELGQPGPFRERLLAAIDRVLAVQPLDDMPIRLKQPSVYYRYADPQLEAASDVEKLLWRMGPRNTVRIQIQSQLRDLKLALTRS